MTSPSCHPCVLCLGVWKSFLIINVIANVFRISNKWLMGMVSPAIITICKLAQAWCSKHCFENQVRCYISSDLIKACVYIHLCLAMTRSDKPPCSSGHQVLKVEKILQREAMWAGILSCDRIASIRVGAVKIESHNRIYFIVVMTIGLLCYVALMTSELMLFVAFVANE